MTAPFLDPTAALPPPAAAGSRRLRQAYSRLALKPSSRATTSADLPLASQLATASRLKVVSYWRRTGIGDAFKGFIISWIHDSSSVISAQPQGLSLREGIYHAQPRND